MNENMTFDSIKIGLASPEMIKSWSHGEVTKPETINYRTQRPEKDGLFCEKIFGPTKDWECLCGKYKRIRYKGRICEKCGVEITSKKVRRERMGHIELATPVSHSWYVHSIPSRMSLILDITPKKLEKVLYFANYIVLDPGTTPYEKKTILTSKEYEDVFERYEHDIKVGMGAEAIKQLLSEIDLDELSEELRTELENATGQKKVRIVKRLEVVESFRKSGNRPEWMILDILPVIPPEIRPMVQLDGGRFATSDLNDLYRRVINRNNRLKKMKELHAPEIVVRNEKRMLQEAVDSLIDNGRRGRPVTGGTSNRPLKSLSEMLRGKQGRFRQNLLGKRVDYSGRSVIVVGPELKIYQCGLPKEMALELFKPFVMKRLVETQDAANIKDAKKKVERAVPEVYDALENVIKDHPVMLNRAPTLHRLSIQAFEPVLVEGRAIKLHPLVCSPFNADFDGDQMSVHVPLSNEAQAEARFLMLSANNFLKPADGKAVNMPSQDMVMGSYWLTIDRAGEPGEGGVYRNFDEAMMAYSNGYLGLHAPIKVRIEKEVDGVKKSGIVDATLGRLIFNQSIPQDLGFVDRTNPETEFDLEVNYTVGKKQLGKIINETIKKHDIETTANVLDNIKANGFKFATKAAVSIAISDVVVPKEKADILAAAEAQVEKIQKQYNRGFLSNEERYHNVIVVWEQVEKDITKALEDNLSRYNPIKMMADSGARGSIGQIRQLAGLRGLMQTATGKTIEIPIKSNFREGLKELEYFTGARSSRKTLSDTALKTADSGYLTRRLVDVSQDVIVKEEDCGTKEGIWVYDLKDGNEIIEPLAERLPGRFTIGDIINPKTGEVIVKDNELISKDKVQEIIDCGITKVHLRSILKCKSKCGVCAHCYGSDLSSTNGTMIAVGEAVGVIAAQSIGEPGTQLTMRTFHSGGVATESDITQGLPRVEELFEARKPKRSATLSEISGTVKTAEVKRVRNIIVTDDETKEEVTYSVPLATKVLIKDGDHVNVGEALTEGSYNLLDVLRISGIDALYDYILREVHKVYHLQDIRNSDKHIEVIMHQMTRKIKVETPGDTSLLEGTVIDVTQFDTENDAIQARIDAGETTLRKAEGSPILLGITKASLQTDSFLSAASFQETTKMLTDAAIKGKVDHLIGLKENVIIGKLIPAGTGLDSYRGVTVEPKNAPHTDTL
ncbi:MAG: DNA-directed RNA polymerase subunit beta' [Clostridiales bacterium]|nr:DNA-directed RNA polymerase subunit beta' [Clostridiales bacterium]